MITKELIVEAFKSVRMKAAVDTCVEYRNYIRYSGQVSNCTKTFGKRLCSVEKQLNENVEEIAYLDVYDEGTRFSIDASKPEFSPVSLNDAVDKAGIDKMLLPIILGEGEGGLPVTHDLGTGGCHVLVCGGEKSGKTSLLKGFATTLTNGRSPDDVQLAIIDFKKDGGYENMSQLRPFMYGGKPITDIDEALEYMEWLHEELERRYFDLLANAGESNIRNLKASGKVDEAIPYIVTIIDGYEEVVLGGRRIEFDNWFRRINAKSKAVGIHLILSTLLRSYESEEFAISPVILNNFPVCICMKTDSPFLCRIVVQSQEPFYLKYPGEMIASFSLDERYRLQAYLCE